MKEPTRIWIINLLGFSDSDRKTIMYNLAEGRPGTTDAEREVTFTAGGAAAVRVMVTIRIGQDSAADLNEQASDECDCDEARRQRERRAKMEAAGMWAQNMFSKENGQLQTVLCAIRSTFEGAIDYVTIKIGKRTHKIDTDSDGMTRIRSTFRDSNEETF